MKAYSFKNVVMLVNGVELDGFGVGDDTIACDRAVDSALPQVSVDGVMTVSMSNDLSGTIVFRLMQNSESNGYLSGLFLAQENGAFVPTFIQLSNTQGGELVSGTQGFINKPAPLSFGQSLQEVEWTITVERLDIFNAGSA